MSSRARQQRPEKAMGISLDNNQAESNKAVRQQQGLTQTREKKTTGVLHISCKKSLTVWQKASDTGARVSSSHSSSQSSSHSSSQSSSHSSSHSSISRECDNVEAATYDNTRRQQLCMDRGKEFQSCEVWL